MRRNGSPQELERVRHSAVRMHAQGIAPKAIARAVDRTMRTVHKWIVAVRDHGPEAINARPHAGAEPKLSPEQREDLRERLLEGAQAHGFSTDLWTAPRVRQLIQQQYGVAYHVNYVPELMKALNFSPQKPVRRARERDEEAIAQWRRRDWPRIKKRRGG